MLAANPCACQLPRDAPCLEVDQIARHLRFHQGARPRHAGRLLLRGRHYSWTKAKLRFYLLDFCWLTDDFRAAAGSPPSRTRAATWTAVPSRCSRREAIYEKTAGLQ